MPNLNELREAVEASKKELDRTYDCLNELVKMEIENPNQPLMNFAINKKGFEERIKWMQTFLDLATEVINAEMPQELEPIAVDIGVGTLESQYEQGYNQALHDFRLYQAKEMGGTSA